ncbi:MAG: hypothetical protein ACRC3J_04880 [Culicoidibacterales bacterium]
MLSFEEKKNLIETNFPELTSNPISLGRINYQFLESTSEKINVISHLHPNGNGFVYVGTNSNHKADAKGLVNIRDFSEADLITIIQESIKLLATPPVQELKENPVAEIWINANNVELALVEDLNEELFFVYTDEDMLDSVFNSYSEAVDYLDQEGFEPL